MNNQLYSLLDYYLQDLLLDLSMQHQFTDSKAESEKLKIQHDMVSSIFNRFEEIGKRLEEIGKRLQKGIPPSSEFGSEGRFALSANQASANTAIESMPVGS